MKYLSFMSRESKTSVSVSKSLNAVRLYYLNTYKETWPPCGQFTQFTLFSHKSSCYIDLRFSGISFFEHFPFFQLIFFFIKMTQRFHYVHPCLNFIFNGMIKILCDLRWNFKRSALLEHFYLSDHWSFRKRGHNSTHQYSGRNYRIHRYHCRP